MHSFIKRQGMITAMCSVQGQQRNVFLDAFHNAGIEVIEEPEAAAFSDDAE
jgi:hypothetical protein